MPKQGGKSNVAVGGRPVKRMVVVVARFVFYGFCLFFISITAEYDFLLVTGLDTGWTTIL
jgi:hypothetical protein